MTKRKLIFVIINFLFALKIFAQSEDSFATQKLKPLKKDEVLEWEFNFDEGDQSHLIRCRKMNLINMRLFLNEKSFYLFICIIYYGKSIFCRNF